MPHIYTYKSIILLGIYQKMTAFNKFIFWDSDKMLLSAFGKSIKE